MLVPTEAIAARCLFVANHELPSEQLALAEPLSCVVNGQRWSRVEVDDVVLIMGAGPIGLFHLQLALLAGARAVIVSEPSGGRRSQAERLGATMTVDPTRQNLDEVVEELSRGVGADSSIICVGVPQLVNQAVRLSRSGGRVNVFAGLEGEGWAEIEANLIHYKQVLLTGSANSRRADYETALRLIESGRIDTASMVTHRFPLSAVTDAIAAVTTGAAIKAAVLP
jgi:L-iditol 2-dehydrogenase